MGVFSWLDCKTNKAIKIGERCYVLIPQKFGGGHICEYSYNGYGEFGAVDIFGLIAEWNTTNAEALDADELRDIGIDLAGSDEDNKALAYPIKITTDENAKYEECNYSKIDPNQGY